MAVPLPESRAARVVDIAVCITKDFVKVLFREHRFEMHNDAGRVRTPKERTSS